MELEWLAAQVAPDGSYPFDLARQQDVVVVDTRAVIAAVANDSQRGTSAALIARRFHSTIVDIITCVCQRLRVLTGLDLIVLSGGVFLNAILTREVTARLLEFGFQVYRHRRVPPNDGGLCLGQLAIAAALGENSTHAEVGHVPGHPR
jgi:hydrogenase maturation protein HypF